MLFTSPSAQARPRIRGATFAIAAVALGLLAMPSPVRAQTCWICGQDINGSAICVVTHDPNGGFLSCTSNGIQCSFGNSCPKPNKPSAADTSGSETLVRYGPMRATLRRAPSGWMFLVFDVGRVTEVRRNSSGDLVLTKCDGAEVSLKDFVSSQ